MRQATLYLGDCVEVLRGLDAESVDAIVCDPPYGLEFMGKSWDYELGPDGWATEALRVLKPGAHLLAFGGTRTYHRLACAIEDAGFEIRDSLHWIYGSGFPKSHNGPWGGTALKPSHEPIVVARKPLIGTVAENVERFGTGALNVDGCRVSVAPWDRHEYGISGDEGRPDATTPCYGKRDRVAYEQNDAGRWPPNLLLSHSPDCGDACADDCPVAEMDRQSGASQSRVGEPRGSKAPGDGWGMTATGAEYADSGGASRFFPCFRYEAKPSRAERNAGLEGMDKSKRDDSRRADQPSMNGGKGNAYNRGVVEVQNSHPTVKPVALMAWLCRLVTPQDGTVLDPFLGSGTTGIAALREGFRFLGIEREQEYFEIARRRIQQDAPMFNRVTCTPSLDHHSKESP